MLIFQYFKHEPACQSFIGRDHIRDICKSTKIIADFGGMKAVFRISLIYCTLPNNQHPNNGLKNDKLFIRFDLIITY